MLKLIFIYLSQCILAAISMLGRLVLFMLIHHAFNLCQVNGWLNMMRLLIYQEVRQRVGLLLYERDLVFDPVK